MSSDRKWIRLPGPNEKRGQGRWQEVRGEPMEIDWDRCSRTFLLPIGRTFEDQGRMRSEHPRFVVEGGWMIDTFHNVGVKIAAGDPHSLKFAQMQLHSLLEQCLVLEGDTNAEETH